MPSRVDIFGIRHHGPGSARSLKQALQELQPDVILVEGPPEGEAVLPLVTSEEMQPPVALLVYAPENPGKAVFYPFTTFSPEWQAITFAVDNKLPIRFIDLPQTNWLAMKKEAQSCQEHSGDAEAEKKEETESEPAKADPEAEPEPEPEPDADLPALNQKQEDEEREPGVRQDPLSWLARAAGYSDGERWWEHLVEQRRDSKDLFAAILEAIGTLRSEFADLEAATETDKMEPYREAHMRNAIRAAQKEGHEKIAVVCGAWHAPALNQMPPAKADTALLKGLPKLKVESTWVPWTHARLSYFSGYGAGVRSPGWYHHLWSCNDSVIERWMTRAARLLRDEGLDASSAQVIDAVRLATSLAAVRGRPLPGLSEVTESTQAVMCFGNDVPMRLIHNKLIVGEALGTVPEATPSVPLQKDLQREQKRLRMPAEAAEKMIDLDLRKENDLARSHLLHRLKLLGITWGSEQKVTGKSGTFHEIWALRWMPEFALTLIESGKWGRTVLEAAEARAIDIADNAEELPQLTELLEQVLLANLLDATERVMQRIQNLAAIASDIGHLMEALPPLTRVARYGNVRKTDAGTVENVIDGLVARICVSLPSASASLSDEAAEPMFQRLLKVDSAIKLLNDSNQSQTWQETLFRLTGGGSVHGLIAGRSCRLLLETKAIGEERAARTFGQALSIACGPTEAAAWADGFLRGSGLLIIHDHTLWRVVDDWVCSLSTDAFMQVLPLLRRTFSTFQPAERRQMGERLSRTVATRAAAAGASEALDLSRADSVLPVLAVILGLAGTSSSHTEER